MHVCVCVCVCVLITQSYLTKLLCLWTSPGKNTAVACHSLLQGFFQTQELNPGLLHCRQILYHLNPQGAHLCSKSSFRGQPAWSQWRNNPARWSGRQSGRWWTKSLVEGPLVFSYDSTLVWDETLKGAVVQVVISIKRLCILVGERETLWFNRPGFAYCLILAPLICRTWNKSFIFLYLNDFVRASFGGSVVKTPPANAGDAGSIPRLGRSPGEGNGNPLQYCCLEIPWMKEPGRLQSMGLQRIRLNWVTEHEHDFVRPETPSTT